MIRKATESDAEAFCNIIRTSIIELCGPDHQGNKETLEDWLENKTVENCKAWIINENSNSFIAEKNGNIVGVCHIGHNGHLFLCYVLPSVKGLGIGGALLSVAERSVVNLDSKLIFLESTVTARGFYKHHGYIEKDKDNNDLNFSKLILP